MNRTIILGAAIAFGSAATAHATNALIDYPSFGPASDLTLVGNAAYAPGVVRLTPAAGGKVGAAWTSTKVDVASGFQTYFDFKLWGGFREGDGVTFTIQNSSPTAIGSGGQGIGYVGIANSLTVEFDTWYNGSSGNAPYPNNDPSSSHVAIMSRGTLPNSDNHIYQLGTAATATAEPLWDVPERAYITYTPGQLKVYVNDISGPAVATANVNLSTLLALENGTAYIGFTGATGFGYRNQDIQKWKFANAVDPMPTVISQSFTYNGHTYLLLEDASWTDSEAKAQLLGGHLVTINDAAEQAWVNSTFSNLDGVERNLWIGLNDIATEGAFVWTSGDGVAYTNWASGQPDNASDEDCGQIRYTTGGKWNDGPNKRQVDTRLVYGVVEIVPEPSSLLWVAIGSLGLLSVRTSRMSRLT